MDWRLHLVPEVPLWVLGFLLAIAVIAVGIAAYARSRGTIWRGLVFLILIFALAGPRLIQEDRQSLNDIAVVIVDESLSQSLGARPDRSAAALRQLENTLAEWPNLDVRVRQAGTRQDSETRLFAPLDTALADVPPNRLAGVIFLTDGQVHDARDQVSEIDAETPVHVLLTGQKSETDRRITLQNAPRYGIVDQTQIVRFTVDDVSGEGKKIAAGDVAEVTLRIDGEDVATKPVIIGEKSEMEFRLAHGGDNIVELRAAERPGEITILNNRAVFSTNGIRDRLRVLLVSGEPHAGERTWRNLLKADGSVDLVHFTILRPPEKQDGTPINELSLIAFPTRELFSLKLAEFDLIIFDRYQRRGVLPMIYLDNVVEYVRNGGAVLAASGPSFAGPTSIFRSPLGNIFPAVPTGAIIEEPFRVSVNQIGRRHPVTRGLPGAGATETDDPTWGRWFRLIDTTAERGDIVMEGPEGKPLMVLNREGEGRVAQLLSDQAWLWTRGYEGGGPQAELLRRLAHWLMKEPELEEERLIATHIGTKVEISRHSVKGEVDEVTITSPSGNETRLALNEANPGTWGGTIEAEEQGFYRLSSGNLSTLVAVGSIGTGEMADIVTTPNKLAPLAAATDGGIYWIADEQSASANVGAIAIANEEASVTMPRLRPVRHGRQAHGDDWLGLRQREAFNVIGLNEIPLMSGLIAAAFLLSLLGWMWAREGR